MLKSYLPAILRLHPANVRVYFPVRSAGRSRVPPTRLSTVSGSLAVLLVRSHHALTAIEAALKIEGKPLQSLYLLPASEQLHLARVLVDVAVATADWTVLRSLLAVHRTVLSVRTDVVAGPQMGQIDA